MARTPVHTEPRLGPRDGEQRLVRRRKGASDIFHIDPELIPPGVSYEWKRKAVYGQENPAYMLGLMENHWKPVDVSRLPHMMPDGWTGAIERDGLILMERPSYLTEEARQEDEAAARAPIKAQQERLGQNVGILENRNAAIRTTYSEIPD